MKKISAGRPRKNNVQVTIRLPEEMVDKLSAMFATHGQSAFIESLIAESFRDHICIKCRERPDVLINGRCKNCI